MEVPPSPAKPSPPKLTIPTNESSNKVSEGLPILLGELEPKCGLRDGKPTHAGTMGNCQDQSRPPSTSSCGDLEVPYRVTPREAHFPAEDVRHEPNRRPEMSLDGTGYEGGYDHRSRSRTSNMSRKRSSVNKHRSKPDPERKRVLMHQVAQYWNECISIAEEEKTQAKLEIDHLRESIREQNMKLQEARQQLDGERAEHQDIETKLMAATEEIAKAELENSTLSQESKATKEALRTSKERAAVLSEKSKTYRTKLNEAILEQQRLFLQAKEFYQDSIKSLRQENETRQAEAKSIEAALKECHQKRDKMRQYMDELRIGLQGEIKARKTSSLHTTVYPVA